VAQEDIVLEFGGLGFRGQRAAEAMGVFQLLWLIVMGVTTGVNQLNG
jgi:hypothetical protein